MARITILGGTVAGMAAAARLAKQRHEVTLVADPDALVADADPPAATDMLFPAPWRDLFRKSGRTMDAELTRHGLRLVPAPARRLGTERWELPHERGAQFTAIADRYDTHTAERWRDLLDGLDDVWQIRRRLGMEFSFDAATHRRRRAALWSDRSVADLAAGLPADLADLVRSTASEAPERSPAVDAVWLTVERTFGRWQLVDSADRVRPIGQLVEVLAGRVEQRRVTVTPDLPDTVDAVVDARRRTPRGPWYRRPTERTKQWWRRGPRRYVAGQDTPAGTGTVGELLSAALATYAVHLDLTGTDIHPSVKK